MGLRLLFLNHNYRYSGTFYRAMPMAEQLARRGHDVTLFVVSRERRWTPAWSVVSGVRLCEAPNLARRGTAEGYAPLDILLRMAHALAHRYDIIQMFDHKPNASFAGFTGRLRGAALVADWADWWGGQGSINDRAGSGLGAVRRFEAGWEVKSKLWADGVVTISTVLQQRAIAVGCRPERVAYIPTGAATDRIRPMPLAEARARLGLPPDRRIVGFIGMGQGDLAIVMEALRQLPDVWLMVIGAANPAVADLARATGIADRLWQTGFVPDDQVGVYLGCANLMCLPMCDRAANRGRLPNKLLDYMAAGRPTVASPIGDVAIIVQRYGVGLLAEDSAFFQAVWAILENSQLQHEMGQAARRTAETFFNWSSLISQLEEFYHRILAGQQGVRHE
ncbi:MAG: glycosyltransferase family 4 protein [Chloroflexi bacterium]|nr:glycosyltransferase family 4 protein [Chloroflexota bacterium]